MKHEHALALLDFHRIRADVAGYASSEEGAEGIVSSLPDTDPEAVETLKSGVSALRELLREGAKKPQLAFHPIGEAIRSLAKEGMTLSLESLFDLGLWAESFASLVGFVAGARLAELKLEAKEAPDLQAVSGIVFSIVDRAGELRDLPELKSIRSRIRGLHADIEKATSAFFQDPDTRAMLQSDTPTQRDGRTVLAVRANFKARIRGIVHEISSSGQTVFIEPEALVRRNNELVEEEARFMQEVQRILRETTGRLRAHREALALARGILARLDGLYARARHAHATDGIFAEPCGRGVQLRKARHPVLGSRAVPIDLVMPEDARTLIITGPNTGGKTVSLKTLGLFVLMNQFGLALPAGYGTRLECFDSVWADIGDEQSIDQSLSTFSGHMRTVSAIVEGAGPRSLVLLDELGSGTDPEEGCAIAMALLDRFIDCGALSVVTTHHGILKNYGYTKPGVLNASVDFDKDTLSPTYRIVMGVPGESHALDIASRNGVDPAVVEGARRYLSEERTDISLLIRGLSEKHRELEDLRDEQKRRIRDAMEERRKADLKELRLKQRETELRSEGVSELKSLLSESRKTLENLVKDVREGTLTREKTLGVKEFLSGLERAVDRAERDADERAQALAPELPAEDGACPENAPPFGPGVDVFVEPGRKRGRIARAGKGGQWVVEIGALKMTVPESRLSAANPVAAGKPSIVLEAMSSRDSRAAFELDIRGMRLSEAVASVDRQMNDAIMDGLSGFSIIHGTGEGVLQRGVREYLSASAHVKDFAYARPEEGGFGKTVVTLG